MSVESLEFWKNLFEITGVVLLLLTFIAGAGVVGFSRKLNAVQAEQLLQFDKGLTDAKLELGKQQERASNADARVAGLEQDVAAAKTEMAKQQTRAATAERDLLELQERLKPRKLTDKQSTDFVAILSKLPNTKLKFGHTWAGGDEAFNLLQQLLGLFKAANWDVPKQTSETSNHLDIQVIGVALLIPGPEGSDVRKPEPVTLIQLNTAQTTIQAAFKTVGIDLQFQKWFHTADGVPELVIGSKPNP